MQNRGPGTSGAGKKGRGMISTSVMVLMGVLAALTALAPLGVMVFLRRRGGRWGEFLIGAGTFFLFALMLEPVVHRLVLGGALGAAIQGNIWFYGLYGGLMAGLLEETGRFIAFKVFLKKRREPVTALSYGIGHGGCEAFLLLGLTYISNLVLYASVNGGAEVPAEIMTGLESLAAVPAGVFLWAGFERLSAMVFHMACSVLVFAAVSRPGKLWMFPAAILAHAVLDFIAVTANARLPVAATEFLVAAFAAGAALMAARVYKNLGKSAEIS